MKARDAIGKRIVRVAQTRRLGSGGMFSDLQEIELDDGTVLRFLCIETETDSGVEARAVKPGPRKAR